MIPEPWLDINETLSLISSIMVTFVYPLFNLSNLCILGSIG
jgi:hypothetical protein